MVTNKLHDQAFKHAETIISYEILIFPSRPIIDYQYSAQDIILRCQS